MSIPGKVVINMSELKLQISENIKQAMRAQAKQRLSTLRMASAAIKQKEVDERIELSDSQIMDILSKMIKQRKESVTHFVNAGRTDLSQKEQVEIAILEEFLPTPLSALEIDDLIQDTLATTGATSVKDLGTVMTALKLRAAGRADMAILGQKVKAWLNR